MRTCFRPILLFFLSALLFCFYSKNPPLSSADSSPSSLPAPPSETSTVGKPFELTLRSALEIALRSYPGIGAAQQGILASKAGIGVAQSQYYPTLTGSTTYTRETGNFGPQPGFPFTIPESPVSFDFYQAQLTLSETLFSFGRRRSQVSQNRHLY